MNTTPASTEGYRILVVDDNPAIHSDFRRILCPRQSTSCEADELEAVLFEKQEEVIEAAAEAGKLLSKRLSQGHDRTQVTAAMQKKFMEKFSESS